MSIRNKAHVFSNEIFYITNFLDISTTLDFLDAINFNWTDNPWAKQLFRKKKENIIETLYNYVATTRSLRDLASVARRATGRQPPELRLQQLIRLFHDEINVEDLICLMANIYPNKPILEKTLFFDLLQYYTFSENDLELLRVHFRCYQIPTRCPSGNGSTGNGSTGRQKRVDLQVENEFGGFTT